MSTSVPLGEAGARDPGTAARGDAASPPAGDEAALLVPLSGFLAAVDYSRLRRVAPAMTFDPLDAAGGRTWRVTTVPPPPERAAPVPPDRIGLVWSSIRQLAALCQSGALSAAEVQRAFADRAAALNAQVNAFIFLARPAGDPRAPTGALAGVPLAVKDLIDVAGLPTTCGSRWYAGDRASGDATCWARLVARGAVLAGKTNTHELAAGVTSRNDHFGAVRNPWDLARMSGGSSGGSAAAVAAGMAAAALGTDTGGSVRVPASFCGVVGLKPTFGAVPTDGVQPLAWSLDHVGPLARTVADAGLLFDALTGHEGAEPGAAEAAATAGAGASLSGVVIGVIEDWLDGLEPVVAAGHRTAVAALRDRGAVVEAVRATELLPLEDLVAMNRLIAYAEGSAAHLHALRRAADFGAEIRGRMRAGRQLGGPDYLVAQQLRTIWCRQLGEVWRRVDVLVTPTVPCVAPPLEAETTRLDGRDEALGTALVRFTAPFNLAGVPAMSIPVTVDGPLPVGVQFVAPPGCEPLTCYVAAACEATAGARSRPALELS